MRKPMIQENKANKKPQPEAAVKKVKQEVVLPTRKALEDTLKKMIIGQDDFIKKVTVGIYRRLMLGFKSNILVIGDSGSGKTQTLKLIAELLDLPYTIESATEYTQSGYVGKDIEDIIENLYDNAIRTNKGLAKMQLGIVIMDEIDKKAESDSIGRGESVSGKAVQQRLLKFMDGMECPIYGEDLKEEALLDTRGLIFICMGAFEGLDKIREKRLGSKRVGFETDECKFKGETDYIEDDFIQYGMIKEFIGRFDCIAETKKLTESDLEKIAKESKISEFKHYEEFCEEIGIKLEYSDNLFKNIAKKAISMHTGARAIKNVVNNMFENIVCDIMDGEFEGNSVCRLDDNIVSNNKLYKWE